MLKYLYMAFSGKKEATILEPSRGGMGIKLKIARNIFIVMAFTKIALTTPNKVIFTVSNPELFNPSTYNSAAGLFKIKDIIKRIRPYNDPKINARSRLVPGPAIDVFLKPFLKFLKYVGLIGTGFA